MPVQWEATGVAVADVPTDGLMPLTVAGHRLIMLATDGHPVAYQDACPHEGFALSRHGERQDFVIVCNKHLWEFDTATGEHISRLPKPHCNLRRYPVREVDGCVEVDVSAWPVPA
jgi:nitrite reductase/ring-hydroxylating ferredoxin subunit